MKKLPVIVKCEISPRPLRLGDPLPEVSVTFDDGTEEVLFRFYPDEIDFTPSEFLGLTADEARQLYGHKDRQYLKS